MYVFTYNLALGQETVDLGRAELRNVRDVDSRSQAFSDSRAWLCMYIG